MRAITVTPYLDDLLARSYQRLEINLQIAQDFLRSLGRLTNKDKSHLVPSQEVAHLGYDVMASVERKIFLPGEKIRKMDQSVAWLQTNLSVLVREIMKVIGLMTSCFLAVPWVRFHQHPLQNRLLQ